ncbi:hypothetical protein ASE75_13725 [Sphingomonas sp. Leaf17]|uniref:hypothetical protein n=1 Tax=Sphingomonas sp. Leaf17 TaxID=1735683 RepID=UPI0006F60236|nr:hypothetical protein [Sphingomonas sp. Leaf17]KQM62684.1 hypothetical protein ASE75_13725 [Sphingomonas sp. Leaf17]
MNTVVSHLHAAEKAFDEAVAAAAQLGAALPVARLTARMSAVVGQDALASTMQAFRLIVEARGCLVDAHRQLDHVKTEMGLRTVAVGGGYEKPLGAMPTVDQDLAA